MEERTRLALKPKRETQLVPGGSTVTGGNLPMPGNLGPAGDFKSFVNKAGPPRGKKQMLKAARMPAERAVRFDLRLFQRVHVLAYEISQRKAQSARKHTSRRHLSWWP